jgi:hypothetical protein
MLTQEPRSSEACNEATIGFFCANVIIKAAAAWLPRITDRSWLKVVT